VSLTVWPGSDVYEVVVSALAPEMQGVLSLALNADAAALPAGTPTTGAPPGAPTLIPTATLITGSSAEGAVDAPPSDVCSVSPNGGFAVNLRAGPSTDYTTVIQLRPLTYLAVSGYYVAPDGYWYVADYPGLGQVWIFGGVVNLNGLCNTLPQVSEPSTQTDGVTATVTATATHTPTVQGASGVTGATATYTLTPTATQPGDTGSGQQVSPPTATYTPSSTVVVPTATYTPSYTPTRQATATYTPSYTPTTQPAAQVAPEDPRFNNPLNIPLDNTASVLDFVSYPGGDTEDRVRWDITGMNANASLSGGRARLVIAVSCFGEGTEHVQFFTGGQTYSCGQTLVDREVTYDSRTGSVVITAVGGSGTYVQWVLTGTATRTN
jgi:hypothetical protein